MQTDFLPFREDGGENARDGSKGVAEHRPQRTMIAQHQADARGNRDELGEHAGARHGGEAREAVAEGHHDIAHPAQIGVEADKRDETENHGIADGEPHDDVNGEDDRDADKRAEPEDRTAESAGGLLIGADGADDLHPAAEGDEQGGEAEHGAGERHLAVVCGAEEPRNDRHLDEA